MSPVYQHFANDNIAPVSKQLTILMGRQIHNEYKHRVIFMVVGHSGATEKGRHSGKHANM